MPCWRPWPAGPETEVSSAPIPANTILAKGSHTSSCLRSLNSSFRMLCLSYLTGIFVSRGLCAHDRPDASFGIHARSTPEIRGGNMSDKGDMRLEFGRKPASLGG